VNGEEIGQGGLQVPQTLAQIVRHCETGMVAPPAASLRLPGVRPSNVSECRDSFLILFFTASPFQPLRA